MEITTATVMPTATRIFAVRLRLNMPACLHGSDRRHVGYCPGRVMSTDVRMLEQRQVTRRQPEEHDPERKQIQNDSDFNPRREVVRSEERRVGKECRSRWS